MGRHSYNSNLRVLPKLWVQHLRHKFGAELWELDAQLTLPPNPHVPFRFGYEPEPLSRRLAPKTFEHVWKLGKNPDERLYAELQSDGRYNLFLRVAQHVPLSEDWLFRPLRPYFSGLLPPVTASATLAQALLRRLGLRRLSDSATKFVLWNRPAVASALDPVWIQVVSSRPDPIHLMLMIAIFHERKWHHPELPETEELAEACFRACDNFFNREEFCPPALDESLCRDFYNAFRSTLREIMRTGHRSAPPALPHMTSPFDRKPSGPDAVGLLTAPRCILYEPFEASEDAVLTSGYGLLVPPFLFFDDNPTPYRPQGGVPSPAQAERALDDLVAAADITVERVHRYGRSEQVKQQLERLRFRPTGDSRHKSSTAAG